jgi:LuxR family transcriptional regulator, maltose regulon positive regulatory protein
VEAEAEGASSRLVLPEQQDGAARPSLTFELPESKFLPPRERPGIVSRLSLLDRLADADEPLISVVASPGYGKTTLLAQWARTVSPRVAWVTCDHADNDPVVLLSSIAVAINRIQPIDPAVFPALISANAAITFVPRFVSAIAHLELPIAVVLDNLETVTNRDCQNLIAELVLRRPPGWRFAFGSRKAPPLPVARLRVEGEIIEIGADDLAMDAAEAASLLKGAGAEPDAARIAGLIEVTEGWPAGLYLAALALRAGKADVGVEFAADDRFVEEYLRSELLDQASESDVVFLTRTSILDSMSGPLCDAVLDRTGSADLLEDLEARNLLVIPLDHSRHWYRYHHLLRDLLQSELRRREPDQIAALHGRAAEWYEANGRPEAAIAHAEQAGDYDRQARLVLELAQPVWAGGRVRTVLQWMEAIQRHTSANYFGAIAVHGALILALLGQPADAERWAHAAERAPDTGALPDGSTMSATLAYLRAILCRNGVDEMRRDARLAWDGLSPTSPYRATMLHTEGIAYLLQGDADRADAAFAHTFDLATSSNAQPLVAMVLAERCIVAGDRGDWADVMAFSGEAIHIVEDGGFEDYWTSALVYAWAARAAVHQGEVSKAKRYLTYAARLRPLLTYALPVVSVQTLLELARCYIALGDVAGTSAVLRQAQSIIQQRPRLGTLPAAAADLRERLARLGRAPLGASSLTAAELRLLPLLSTHLTLSEIADRLSVSSHTIKSHTNAIYRKLEVTSRSQAVRRARELGLTDL